MKRKRNFYVMWFNRSLDRYQTKFFSELSEAVEFANRYHSRTGIMLGIQRVQ